MTYPTVWLRLDRLIQKIKLSEDTENKPYIALNKQQRTVFGLLLFLRKIPAGYFRPPSREKKPKVMGQTMLAKPIARKYSKK